ncbi:hypothetical protein BC828DRAFT_419023 [Blastocladiella britannica]|nr:hypothetical protein BC828DRAFT_419023 [Blastocladiella britannica]
MSLAHNSLMVTRRTGTPASWWSPSSTASPSTLPPMPRHWWRDRAIQDGLEVEVLYIEQSGPDPADEDREDPGPETLHSFDGTELVTLVSRGNLELLDYWASLVGLDLLLPCVAPANQKTIAVSRTTSDTARKWWLDLRDSQDHRIALPAFTRELGDEDTCEDAQAFWDLQSRSCARNGVQALLISHPPLGRLWFARPASLGLAARARLCMFQ